MANIKGVPKPPFRIIEPSGAPIRNKTRQASESDIFRCHSILCFLNILSLSFKLVAVDSRPTLIELTCPEARCATSVFAESGNHCEKVVAAFLFPVSITSCFVQLLSIYFVKVQVVYIVFVNCILIRIILFSK